MYKRYVSLLISLVMLFILSSNAFGEFVLGAFVGQSTPTLPEAENHIDPVLSGGFLTGRVDAPLLYHLEISFIENGFDDKETIDGNPMFLFVNIGLYLAHDRFINPYILGGAGLSIYSDDDKPEDEATASKLAVNGGGGIELRIIPRLFLQCDYRFIYTSFGFPEQLDGDDPFYIQRVTVGIVYKTRFTASAQ